MRIHVFLSFVLFHTFKISYTIVQNLSVIFYSFLFKLRSLPHLTKLLVNVLFISGRSILYYICASLYVQILN
jgi:hypothetical protein